MTGSDIKCNTGLGWVEKNVLVIQKSVILFAQQVIGLVGILFVESYFCFFLSKRDMSNVTNVWPLYWFFVSWVVFVCFLDCFVSTNPFDTL